MEKNARYTFLPHGSWVQYCRKFEDLAVGVLSKCQQSSPEKTILMLHTEIPMFSVKTRERNAIDVAFEADSSRFLAHPATQNLMTKDWYGRINTVTPWWKMLLGFLFPGASLLLIDFVPDVVR